MRQGMENLREVLEKAREEIEEWIDSREKGDKIPLNILRAYNRIGNLIHYWNQNGEENEEN